MSLENTIDTGVITLRLRALSEDSALKILVVDDDELARALLSDRLQSRGFEVTQAGDGREALDFEAFGLLSHELRPGFLNSSYRRNCLLIKQCTGQCVHVKRMTLGIGEQRFNGLFRH
jgi:hypothetical protein